MPRDAELMERALRLAEDNVAAGGWPFSAIIVKDGQVLAEAVNGVHRSHDPSDHAEIAAVRKATAALGAPNLGGATMVVVGQPCPMCLTCMILAGITDVLYAVDVPAKDKALSTLPLTDGLYELVVDGYGAKALTYRQLPDYAAAGEAVFKEWNAGRL